MSKKSVWYDDEGHIDYEVRTYFYRNDAYEEAAYQSPLDLLSFDTSIVTDGIHFAHAPTKDSEALIDEDLLNYSLKGLDSLDV